MEARDSSAMSCGPKLKRQDFIRASSLALTRERAAFLCGVVERFDGVGTALPVESHVRARGSGHIHAFVFEDVVAEERDGGAVHGEAAEGHGLLVRLPGGCGVDVVGDAREGAAVVFDFFVEVEEEDFGDLHGVTSCGGLWVRGSRDVFLAGVVDVGLLGDELGSFGEGFLGGRVEVGGAAGAGLADDAGGVKRAARVDHGGEEQGESALLGVDGDAADAVAVVVAGVDMRGVGESGADLVLAAGTARFVEGHERDGVLAALDEVFSVAVEPGVVGDVFDVESRGQELERMGIRLDHWPSWVRTSVGTLRAPTWMTCEMVRRAVERARGGRRVRG